MTISTPPVWLPVATPAREAAVVPTNRAETVGTPLRAVRATFHHSWKHQRFILPSCAIRFIQRVKWKTNKQTKVWSVFFPPFISLMFSHQSRIHQEDWTRRNSELQIWFYPHQSMPMAFCWGVWAEASFLYFMGSPTFLYANWIPVDPKIILLRKAVVSDTCDG